MRRLWCALRGHVWWPWDGPIEERRWQSDPWGWDHWRVEEHVQYRTCARCGIRDKRRALPVPDEILITERGTTRVERFRRSVDDDEVFVRIRHDGFTEPTHTHWEDVLLDNIARRDAEIAALRQHKGTP